MNIYQPQNQLVTSGKVFEELFKKSKYVISWSRRKLELAEWYASRDEEGQCHPYVTMGEIYYAHLGTNLGSEIDKERPVLVFQNNDRFIKRSNMVVIIPISSNLSNIPYRVRVNSTDIIDNKGIGDSMVIIQQIRSISKARLSQFKGKLSETKLQEISVEINRLLYKNTPLLTEGGGRIAIPNGCYEDAQ